MNRLKVQMVDTGRLVRTGLSSAVVTSVIQVLTLHVQPGTRCRPFQVGHSTEMKIKIDHKFIFLRSA